MVVHIWGETIILRGEQDNMREVDHEDKVHLEYRKEGTLSHETHNLFFYALVVSVFFTGCCVPNLKTKGILGRCKMQESSRDRMLDKAGSIQFIRNI
jgi:hypothetical protein